MSETDTPPVICQVCGALVAPEAVAKHERWHQHLNWVSGRVTWDGMP